MHDLIDISEFPSMPATLSTQEPGEAWIWDDYLAVLQIKPKTMAHALQHLTGQPSSSLPAVEYPFAMSVFYRLSKNPHGPSHRPILVVTLEKINYSAAAAQFGGNAEVLKELGLGGDDGPATKGLFNSRTRLNLGDFGEPLTADNARAYFFATIRQHLALAGEPIKIGTVADVYGHPETGWPAKSKAKAGKLGCVVLVAVLGSLAAAACFALVAML